MPPRPQNRPPYGAPVVRLQRRHHPRLHERRLARPTRARHKHEHRLRPRLGQHVDRLVRLPLASPEHLPIGVREGGQAAVRVRRQVADVVRQLLGNVDDFVASNDVTLDLQRVDVRMLANVDADAVGAAVRGGRVRLGVWRARRERPDRSRAARWLAEPGHALHQRRDRLRHRERGRQRLANPLEKPARGLELLDQPTVVAVLARLLRFGQLIGRILLEPLRRVAQLLHLGLQLAHQLEQLRAILNVRGLLWRDRNDLVATHHVAADLDLVDARPAPEHDARAARIALGTHARSWRIVVHAARGRNRLLRRWGRRSASRA